MSYTIQTLRKRAKAAGYSIHHGFQHIFCEGYPVAPDRSTGYLVINEVTGCGEPGSYNSGRDHLWQLEDVEEFLKGVYEENGLDW
ncbi:MAG: hypothetical protein SOW08_01660 [Lachnospiraceae bacterium]|nr:hypothetical protein [Lachnospiraceae bacterium]